jgi:DNA-binding LacI/PurR family transcriptional regulator
MGFATQDTSLSTIAQRLGVSTSTVSRALRDVQGIRPATRARIVAMAEEMGYQVAGQKPAKKSFGSVLALSQGHGVGSNQRYLAGISRAAMEMNLSLVSHHYLLEECEQVLQPAHQPRALRAKAIDGIVLMHHWPDRVVEELGKQFPIVSIVHSYPEREVDVIALDDQRGMVALVRHLMAMGHRSFGFLGLCREMSWSRSRFAAYVAALAYHGLVYHPENTLTVEISDVIADVKYPEGPMTASLMRQIDRGVRAWVGSSEGLAGGALAYLLERGVKVPEEVSVTGFHGAARSLGLGLPPLTSTDTSSEEIGATALRRLARRMEFPSESCRTILLPCELLPGGTTGPLLEH